MEWRCGAFRRDDNTSERLRGNARKSGQKRRFQIENFKFEMKQEQQAASKARGTEYQQKSQKSRQDAGATRDESGSRALL